MTAVYAESSILDHPNLGCPRQSACEKSYGELRNKFIKSLNSFERREQFFRKHGAPLRYFFPRSKSTSLKNDIAWWDSRCEEHRKKENLMIDGESFIKEINSASEFFGHVIKTVKNKQLLASFVIPHNALVLKINNEGLYFETYQDQKSLRYLISKNGHIFPIKEKIKLKKAKTIPCQKEDILRIKTIKNPKIYSYIECREYEDKLKIIQALSCL